MLTRERVPPILRKWPASYDASLLLLYCTSSRISYGDRTAVLLSTLRRSGRVAWDSMEQ